MEKKRKVLLCGVTGQQGGALAKILLREGHEIIGLSRNPKAQKAKELIAKGMEIRQCNYLDAEDLTQAMREVDTVFAVTTPFEKGSDNEVDQGKALANAAQKAEVGHFIYTSVASADLSTNIPHFDSKYEVEKHIDSLDIPYTIVAPVFFMENLLSPYMMDSLKEGKLKIAMPGDRKLQQIAVEDIAKFSARIINRRESEFGKRYDIAGDELTGENCAEILSRVTGETITYEGIDPEYVKEESVDLAIMFKWFDQIGYTTDIPALKRRYPEIAFQTFETWAKKQDWTVIKDALHVDEHLV
ncbi:MAG: NmrA/HSCARG family protein [Flavobacteriales bacterium]|nr:NmrA/HSCARG family protein [Flavobacteriales bacterium]